MWWILFILALLYVLGNAFLLLRMNNVPKIPKNFRTCSRSLRAAASCVRTERRNRSLHGVNEDFEHRPSANGSGAVGLEQVLITRPSHDDDEDG